MINYIIRDDYKRLIIKTNQKEKTVKIQRAFK